LQNQNDSAVAVVERVGQVRVHDDRLAAETHLAVHHDDRERRQALSRAGTRDA
jgi:hypothetical protein